MCASVRASVRGPCEHDRDYTVSCFFVKLGRHVNHDERTNPIDFGGQRSKVKVTIDIYGNKLVNTIETKPLCISLSNLADMLTMVRGWTLLILEVKGQGHNGQILKEACEHDSDLTVVCFLIKLGRHFGHGKRMSPIDFVGQRSKVKVTMDIYGN